MRKIYLVIFVVIVLVLAGWFIKVNVFTKNAPAVVHPASPVSGSNEKEDIELNTKKYVNTVFGYAVEYPEEWYIDTKNSDSNFSQRGPAGDEDLIGGDTIFSNYRNASTFTADGSPENAQVVTLLVHKVTPDTTYEKYIATHFPDARVKSIDINSIGGKQITITATDHPVGATTVITLLKFGTNIYEFKFSGNPISSDLESAANLIIYSFTRK